MSDYKTRNAVVFWEAGLTRGYIFIGEISKPIDMGTVKFWQNEVVRIIGEINGASPVITGWQMLEA